MKKIVAVSSLLLTAIISLTGCGAESIPSPTSPVIEEEPAYAENTLHDITVTERDLPFITEGKSDYKIVIPSESDYAQKAALFIRQHVSNASGCALEVVEYDDSIEYTSSSHYIVLNVSDLISAAGVKKTSKDLDVTGYQITTKDNSVFIFVNHAYGYQQAAMSFLKHVVGYDRISKDITLYTRDTSTLPEINIVERPDFQIRTQSNKVDINYSYETGFLTSNEVFYHSNDIKFVHNSFDYIPTTLKSEHPSWFANDLSQLCYTAHGDEEEFEAMVEYVFVKMKKNLADDSECTRFALTIEDSHNGCTCDACKASANKYGAESAAVVKFMNAIDTKVQAYLQEIADETGEPKRKMELVFFAYNKVEKPPVKLVDGKYVPTAEEVVCHDTVSVYIAPIAANYTQSFISEANLAARETIEGWSAICSSINYWLYETNFSNYLYPYNSFSTMANTYRYLVNKNASYLYNEGQHNNGAVTAFGRFKEYFNEVVEIDVNTDYAELVDHFFEAYFQDAKEPMLRLFNEQQEHSAYLLNEYYGEITGNIYDEINKSKYWPKQLLDRWLDIIDEAYKLIEHYQYTDLGTYRILYNNICLESIFPRYALIAHHSGKYSSTELSTMKRKFYDDATNLGVSQIKEGTALGTRSEWYD